jgi:hypothetical protein
VENEGVAPVFGACLSDLPSLARWLSQRIREIEIFTQQLPSIAVLVNDGETLEALAGALTSALADMNIRAVACPKGQAIGPENDVRIFEVEHIKGLEFEAVFFVDVDKLAQAEPDLFDKSFMSERHGQQPIWASPPRARRCSAPAGCGRFDEGGLGSSRVISVLSLNTMAAAV